MWSESRLPKHAIGHPDVSTALRINGLLHVDPIQATDIANSEMKSA
jgi:hypothetical protein